MSSANILIIDNDELLVEAILIRLTSEGYTCYTANSGAQGVSMFSELTFDAVLTDLNMPSGDGVSVIREIRKSSNVPVLVLTGFESDFGDDLETFEHVSVINKPFEIDALIDELDLAIGLSEAH